MKRNFSKKNIVLILFLCFTLFIQIENFLFGFQIIKADGSEKNNILLTSAIIDTLISTVTGSTTPPQDPNGGNITNGDFLIERSGNDPVTGNGIDERTVWNFTYSNQSIDSSSQVISAQLILMIEQKDAGASNDHVVGDNCGCTPINVGSHPLNVIVTIQFEMLDHGYQSQVFIDHIMGDGFQMLYQDDAIVSFAELKLIISNNANLNVIEPQAGELWIAGEQDTIRWTSTGIDSVGISFSVNFENGGGSFADIVQNYPADSGYYVWNIPDSILSRKCAISIEDASDPNAFGVSEVFKIKGYQLTRVDANGDYEPYKIGPNIGEDDWVFNNSSPNMWTPEWYQQFDYKNGTDPFTQTRYGPDFQHWLINAQPEEFPDWPSFVRTFGIDQCYFTLSLGGIVKPMAIFYWAFNKGTWGGSCAGFSGSSFLAFDRKADFISRFGIPAFNNLREVQLGSDSRRVINEMWVYQLGTEGKSVNLRAPFTEPNETLEELRQIFRSENGDNKAIDYFSYTDPLEAHAINPWKITKSPTNPGIEYIQVYDNNAPYLDNLAIAINTVENTWTYPTVVNEKILDKQTFPSDKPFGLVLSFPSSSYLHNANIPFTPSSEQNKSLSLISMFNSLDASIIIKNSSGDSVFYDSRDSILSLNIPGVIPNIPLTGYPHPPIGFELPPDVYTISMNDFADSLTYISFFDQTQLIYYGRTDATEIETDFIQYENGIGVQNPDNNLKQINFGAIIADNLIHKQIDILNCAMIQNDSMHFNTINQDEIKIVNANAEKNYDLQLLKVSIQGDSRFEHQAIILSMNSSHQIIPVWNDLSQPVKILIDNGNNGSIDDSIFINNTVDADDQGSLINPTEYNLAQNYPNPFNPITTIKYQLPKSSFVTLKIYDILGSEVSGLVNEEKPAGNYEVKFDASNLSSGIYFYTIKAGDFTATKKMILLR
ncbi:MAG: T9SS type A sorting domain-containing protein [Ignavibacteria bacterium]|nr:T9SS type A sorting domain-containing protein [Ignavibacteria bacterium]